MNRLIPKEPEVQRVIQHDPNVPQRVAGTFIRIRYNLAIAAQRLPEMTDEEVIIANHGKGGFDWLNDPAEDAY